MANDSVDVRPCDDVASAFWDDLVATLADPGYLAALYEHDPFELLRAWAAIEENSCHRVAETYADVIQEPQVGKKFGPGLAELFVIRELCADKVERLLAALVVDARNAGDQQLLADRLGALVEAKRACERGAINEERLELCNEIGDFEGAADALCEKAWSRWLEGLSGESSGDEEKEARRLREELRELCLRRDLVRGLALWADAAAWMLYCEGKPKPMPRLLARQERLLRACGDQEHLCVCLLTRARILRVDPTSAVEARDKLDEAAAVAHDLGLARLFRAARIEQATLALLSNDESGALARMQGLDLSSDEADCEGSLERALRQALEFPDHWARSLEPEVRRGFCERAERLARELGDAGAVQWALGQLASVFEGTDSSRALAHCLERETIVRDLGRGLELAESLHCQAQAFLALGEPGRAAEALRNEEVVCSEHDLEWRLRTVRRTLRSALLAMLHRCSSRRLGAALLAELECVCRQLGDTSGALNAAKNRIRLLRQVKKAPERQQPDSQLYLDL